MEYKEFIGIWNYYLSLEEDLAATSRYVEPEGQTEVHSFEFAKILILSSTECESVFKLLCNKLEHKNVGDIGEYKGTILKHYPRIIQTAVIARRLSEPIHPFAGWATGALNWWDAYQKVKHNRGRSFSLATYQNAVEALSALYILIFYLAKAFNIEFHDSESKYIHSQYSHQYIHCAPPERLPDFIN